jgi:hypothetical protein
MTPTWTCLRSGATSLARGFGINRNKVKAYAAFFIFAFMFNEVSLLPATNANAAELETSDYGIFTELGDLKSTMAERKSDPGVLNETAGRLDEMVLMNYTKSNPLEGIDIHKVEVPQVALPNMFKAAEEFNPEGRFNTLLDLLVNKPLSYYIYTPYQDSDDDWTNGSMRPAVINSLLSASYQTDWVYIDIDNADNDSNDLTGSDIMMRILPTVDSMSPSLGGTDIDGRLTVEILNISWGKPFAAYIVKGISYDMGGIQRTALFMIGFEFPFAPAYHATHLYLENIERNPLGEGTLAEPKGPYKIRIHSDSALSWTRINMNFAEYRLPEGGQSPEVLRYLWAGINITPAETNSNIPSDIYIELQSNTETLPFDLAFWDSSRRTDISFTYGDISENITYLRGRIKGVPTQIELHAEVDSSGPENITNINYAASNLIDEISSDEFVFYTNNLSDISNARFKNIHSIARDVPINIHLEGMFEIEPQPTATPIQINTSVPFVANLVDNIVFRLTARLRWASRVFSSLPDQILSMLGQGGHVVMNAESPIYLEFWLTSETVVLSNYDKYFAFYNESFSGQSSGIIDMSVSGRFTGVKSLNGTVGEEKTNVDMNIIGGGAVHAYFIDESNEFNASFTVANIPETISFDLEKDLVDFSTPRGPVHGDPSYRNPQEGVHKENRRGVRVLHPPWQEDRLIQDGHHQHRHPEASGKPHAGNNGLR